jgi:hypothetical protein
MDLQESWHQFDDESADAYRAWLAYRDLLPAHRSIRNSVAIELGLPAPWDPVSATAAQRKKHASKKRQREKWSSEFGWPTRALQWDEHEAALRVEKRRVAVDEMIGRHAEVGQFLLSRALMAVERIETAREQAEQAAAAAGKPVQVLGFLRSDQAVLRAFELGCRIERAAYGLDTVTADEVPVSTVDRTASPRELMLASPKVASLAAQLLRAESQAEREAAAATS